MLHVRVKERFSQGIGKWKERVWLRNVRSRRIVRTRRRAPGGDDGGEDASRLNAVTHGAFARSLLLPQEDGEAFVRMRERLEQQFKPEGELEDLLWTDRHPRVAYGARGRAEVAMMLHVQRTPAARRRVRRHCAVRAHRRRPLRQTVFERGSAVKRMDRHEYTLERQFHRAIQSLTRQQALRTPQSFVEPYKNINYDDWESMPVFEEGTGRLLYGKLREYGFPERPLEPYEKILKNWVRFVTFTFPQEGRGVPRAADSSPGLVCSGAAHPTTRRQACLKPETQNWKLETSVKEIGFVLSLLLFRNGHKAFRERRDGPCRAGINWFVLSLLLFGNNDRAFRR